MNMKREYLTDNKTECGMKVDLSYWILCLKLRYGKDKEYEKTRFFIKISSDISYDQAIKRIISICEIYKNNYTHPIYEARISVSHLSKVISNIYSDDMVEMEYNDDEISDDNRIKTVLLDTAFGMNDGFVDICNLEICNTQHMIFSYKRTMDKFIISEQEYPITYNYPDEEIVIKAIEQSAVQIKEDTYSNYYYHIYNGFLINIKNDGRSNYKSGIVMMAAEPPNRKRGYIPSRNTVEIKITDIINQYKSREKKFKKELSSSDIANLLHRIYNYVFVEEYTNTYPLYSDSYVVRLSEKNRKSYEKMYKRNSTTDLKQIYGACVAPKNKVLFGLAVFDEEQCETKEDKLYYKNEKEKILKEGLNNENV